mgnify:CR=1 FL=1
MTGEPEDEAGFYDRYWGSGGSYSPLLTLFPLDGGAPKSFSWVWPGQRINAFTSNKLAGYMDGYASGLLPTTHFADYTTTIDPDPDSTLPNSPYSLQVSSGAHVPVPPGG